MRSIGRSPPERGDRRHATGDSVPATLHVTHDEEKNTFYSSIVDRSVRTVVEALGEEDIDAILMTGAPTRSDATVVETPAGFYSLSDVDLVCVCPGSADRAELRRRLAEPLAALNAEYADSCAGIDVVVKTRDRFEAPYPIISNYEMLRSPVVLWGDEDILSSLGGLRPEDIPRIDSLVLMQNRITEKLLLVRKIQSDSLDPMMAVRVLYAIAKLVLDSITAIAFLDRNVPLEYADRVRAFRERYLEGDASGDFGSELETCFDELPAWAAFKRSGDATALAEALGGPGERAALPELARRTWFRYVRYSETLWRTILGRTTGRETAGGDIVEALVAYSRLESAPRSLARTLRTLATGRSPEGLFSRRRMASRWWIGSPTHLAYMTAILVYVSFGDSADTKRIEPALRRYCPFTLPTDFRDLGIERRRAIILDRLALFHETMLLGRVPAERS